MHPILLFKDTWLPIHSYGVMLAVAFLAAIWVAGRDCKRLGEKPEHISNMSLWILLLAMVGARLFHCFVFWDEYRDHLLRIFNVREGGLVFYGGFIGGTAGAMIYMRRHKLNMAMYADIIAPTVALGLGFARIGCLLAGCCHGKVCSADFPFALTFPEDSVGVSGVSLYPTQPAESILSFLIFFVLYFILRPRKKYHGQVVAWFLVMYGVVRTALEFFRNDPRGFLTVASFSSVPDLARDTASRLLRLLFAGGAILEDSAGSYLVRLSESQVVSLVMFGFAAAMFIFLRKRRMQPVAAPAAVPEPIQRTRSGKKRKKK